MLFRVLRKLICTLLLTSAFLVHAQSNTNPASPNLLTPGEEKHLRNVRQLTFGGTTPRPIFPPTTRSLIFMHSGEGVPCDQMYTMPVDTPDGKPAVPKLVSTGKGRDDVRLLFP